MKSKSSKDLPFAPSDFLTAGEVGRRLRLPLSTVYYLAKAGELPAVRFGRSWRFPAWSIDLLSAGKPLIRVLVVDDDSVTRSFVVSALNPQGCQVEEAAGVDEALQLCRSQRFELLFIDLNLPGRNGAQLIHELLGEYSLSQMVVITAQPDIRHVDGLLDLGPITLLRKPLAVTQLIECVKRITGGNLTAGSAETRSRSRGPNGKNIRMAEVASESSYDDSPARRREPMPP